MCYIDVCICIVTSAAVAVVVVVGSGGGGGGVVAVFLVIGIFGTYSYLLPSLQCVPFIPLVCVIA